MTDVIAEFHSRFARVMSQAMAKILENDLRLVEAVIEEVNGIDSGRSVARSFADQLLAAETAATQPAARRIPIDERYYMPRAEPWLPGEYIPRPYYDDDDIGLDRAINEQRLLGRPLTWCQKTGAPLTY